MGLDVHGTRFVLYARGLGASFERTAMIGRQTLHLSAAELRRNLAAFGFVYPLDAVHALCRRNQGFAEPFLEVLGARTIRSFDASAYEHATDIVDLNVALADRYKGQFTAVIDGGSLEHVFNFPIALRSCMEMLAIGGHFLSIVPCNNFLGHGFYQFSPELFFRAFGETNGFEVRKLLVFEDRPGAPWFEVADPARAGRRVELANRWPTYLAVLARKDRETALFTQAVYQSDYETLWEERLWDSPLWRLGRRLMRFVPTPLRVLYGAIERRSLLSRYDPKVFTKAKLP